VRLERVAAGVTERRLSGATVASGSRVARQDWGSKTGLVCVSIEFDLVGLCYPSVRTVLTATAAYRPSGLALAGGSTRKISHSARARRSHHE